MFARGRLATYGLHPRHIQPLYRAYSQELEVLDIQTRFNAQCQVKRVHARDEDGDLLFYEFGPSSQTLAALKDLAFVDIASLDLVVAGRECCMLENSQGDQVTIKAPVDGDVLNINDELLKNPGALAAQGADAGELPRPTVP